MSLHLGELFRRNAEVAPRALAATLGDARLTHAELNDAGNRVGRQLRSRGVGRGDRIVCWMETSLELLSLFVAATKLGAVFAPLNARLRADETLPFLEHARPKLIIADEERIDPLRALVGRLGLPVVGKREQSGRGESAAEIFCHGENENDAHVLFFTSGSTGRPKGVVISHRANYLRTYPGVSRDIPEHSVCMFPLFHMAAYTLALSAWQTGGAISFAASGRADEILSAAAAYRANRLYCIPAVWARILECDLARWDLSSLRELDTGTSATPIELLRQLRARFPAARLRVYYGSTEAGACTALSDGDVFAKPGSVGPPVAGVRARLGDDGELLIRSELLFDEYFDDPVATRAALDGGWYHTGDRAAIDEDGHISIIGRLGELIRSGGEAVAPAEVESVLREHPTIADVAVVGIPDPRWGEIVCAVAIARPGRSTTLPELQRFCELRLAGFKKPRRLEWVEALPRTAATGQVQRALLVQRILTQGR
jgi:acyl-CoA synthetase (AMP-forming)/AMP-acid ligase II